MARSAGASRSMAFDMSGVIWVWGASSYGQIGNGSSGTNQVTPTSVILPGGAAAISAGWHHSLAVSTGGSVWSWGRNNNGQIGNGTSGTTNRTTPYQVALGGTAAAVAAGGGHSLTLLSDKTVKAWGYNGQGQLGLGSTTSQPLPQSGVRTALRARPADAPGRSWQQGGGDVRTGRATRSPPRRLQRRPGPPSRAEASRRSRRARPPLQVVSGIRAHYDLRQHG
ncbi:RCC1 domain-containing protein [Sorangium sp. So ce1153]|uniref:RCC1 domain-containing protein n=1 Tax=Sorangium sp. So ce1153 TaxID=3133333 RepID=UPI003F5DC01C